MSRIRSKITLNYADSLVGKTINNEQVREAIGNVSLTHNNVKITCNRVVQSYDQNKAELFGNVHVAQDTLSIYAPTGTYYGNESKVQIVPRAQHLRIPRQRLRSSRSLYCSIFRISRISHGDARITDNRSYTITSDELDYYRSGAEIICAGKCEGYQRFIRYIFR